MHYSASWNRILAIPYEHETHAKQEPYFSYNTRASIKSRANMPKNHALIHAIVNRKSR